MATLPLILVSPDEFGTTTNWTETWSTYVDDPIATPADPGSIKSASSSGSIHLPLENMPLDFASMLTAKLQIRYSVPGRIDDTLDLTARIMASDETTVLAAANSAGDYTGLGFNHAVGTTWTNSSIVTFSYVNTTATKAQWDGARLWFFLTYSTSMGNDGASAWVSALEVTGTYTAGASAIGKSLDLRWGVRTPVQALDLTLRWAVNDATPEPGYGMGYTAGYGPATAPISKDLGLVWGIRALVADDLDARWDARAKVGDTLSLLWNVQEIAAAAKSLDLVWDVRVAAAKEADLRWGVRTTAADDLGLEWAIRQVAGASSDLRWSLRSLAAADLDARWTVRQPVARDFEVIWQVLTLPKEPVGKDLALLWNLLVDYPTRSRRYTHIGHGRTAVIMRK